MTEIDDRPRIQLRVTDAEFSSLIRTTTERRYRHPHADPMPMGWSAEDEIVHDAITVLAPDLAKEVGRGPAMFDVVVVRPSWLVETGEVARWTRDPMPKEEHRG